MHRDFALILPFFSLGSALTRKERLLFLDCLSAVVGGYYLLIGSIGLTAFLLHTQVINPFTGNPVESEPKEGQEMDVVDSDIWTPQDSYKFSPERAQWWSVHDSIFDLDNWKKE